MTQTRTVAALALAAFPFGVQADGITYLSGDFSIGSSTRSSNENNLTALYGSLEYQMGDFTAYVSAGTSHIDLAFPIPPLGTFRARKSSYAATFGLGYQVMPNVIAYAGVASANLEVEISGFGFPFVTRGDRITYQLGAQAEFGPATFALDLKQRDGETQKSYMAMAEYRLNDRWTLGLMNRGNLGAADSETLGYAMYDGEALSFKALVAADTPGQEVILGFNSDYVFGGKYRVSGSLFHTPATASPSRTSAEFGVGYQLRDNLWIDARLQRTGTSDEWLSNGRASAGLILSYEMGRPSRLVDRVNQIEADYTAVRFGYHRDNRFASRFGLIGL